MHAIAPIPPPSASTAHDIFIGRQPILDREQQLYAYELLFRHSTQNSAQITDDLAATATVLSNVLSEFGLEAALGPYLGFVNLDTRMLMSDAVEMLQCEKFVLEVLETVEITPEVVARCRELKDMGFILALDDFIALEERHKPLLELADIVKVDLMRMDESALVRTVQSLRPWKVRLLAEKVDDEAQAKRCRDLGFELFQGYYFAKPTIIAGKKLSQSELSLVRLLGLILDDAETPLIENIFKQEPGLTLNLMRLTNSAASGLRQKIISLRHAITVLGRRQLQRWLQLLLYANPSSGGGSNPLLQVAATRGRFLELVAGELMGSGQDFEDRAFMTGIMSLMPALLHVPIGEVITSLNVAPEVREALESRSGTLGKMLLLAEKQEENDMEACFALCAELPGLDNERVNALLIQALAWANNINREGAN
ncbi:MAG: EAL domain-containing protein [Betaproteobacteria bacterium]|nr:EAL domain-containing protein [Betaproteobacteria bacterium]